MKIEFHIIQNFAPSNLNRDDTNTPKDCTFGGYRRARISSQCLKRSIRESFPKEMSDIKGKRTRHALRLLQDKFDNYDAIQEKMKLIVADLYTKLDKDGKRTNVLLFLGQEELDHISQIIREFMGQLEELSLENKDDKKKVTEISKEIAKRFQSDYKKRKVNVNAPDIALFGRMVADNAYLKIDAACQVAHAISTHKVDMEFDFWTAVDDLQDVHAGDDAGAGMMGVQGFNSSCFYRYAMIDVDKLTENLNGDTGLCKKAINAFYQASIDAIPTGKQNSMAAQNPPSFVYVVVKDGMAPWSLANSFEKPVHPIKGKSLVECSLEAFDTYWGKLIKAYGSNGIKASAGYSLADIDFENIKDDIKESRDEVWNVIENNIEL